MTTRTDFELAGAQGPIHGVLHRPDRTGPAPAVAICHGFKGFGDWGFFPTVAELLRDRGFAVVRFTFSGAGVRAGDDRVTDREAFRNATFSGDLADLRTVLDAVDGGLGGEAIDRTRFGLLGHSRGGGIALLEAAHRRSDDRLGALVTWAAVSTFARLSPTEIARWKATGEYVIVNSRTGQELSLGLEVLRDVEEHGIALDLEVAAERRTAPWLILHGEADETVPVEEAEKLRNRARPPAELVVVEGAGHTFDAGHPLGRPTPRLTTLFEHTQRWFCRWLRPDRRSS